MCRCAHSTRSLQDPHLPITPPQLKCSTCCRNTACLRSSRPLSALFLNALNRKNPRQTRLGFRLSCLNLPSQSPQLPDTSPPWTTKTRLFEIPFSKSCYQVTIWLKTHATLHSRPVITPSSTIAATIGTMPTPHVI